MTPFEHVCFIHQSLASPKLSLAHLAFLERAMPACLPLQFASLQGKKKKWHSLHRLHYLSNYIRRSHMTKGKKKVPHAHTHAEEP
jgi:hypothetical protein